MDNILRYDAEQRRRLFAEASARLDMGAASIEKDFWVCWTLRELFRLPGWENAFTFKGGTSLSKGWHLISRFSEDLDVVIGRAFLGYGEENMSRNQRDRLRDACRQHIQEVLLPALRQHLHECLPTALDWNLISADVMEDREQLTLLLRYPALFASSTGYLRPVVKMEFGGRADTEPVEMPTILPYLAEALPTIVTDGDFTVRTVAARRTFWEKALLLHEEKLRPVTHTRKVRLARHYYDLWCLIGHGIARQAIDDPGLFERVVQHRQVFYKQSGIDYNTLRRGALDVIPTPEQMPAWQQDFDAMREVMFFEEPPTFDEIIARVQLFQDEFNGVP